MDKNQKQPSKDVRESFDEVSDLEFSTLIAEIEDKDKDILHIAGREFHVFHISVNNLPAEIEKAKFEINQINSLGPSAAPLLLERRAILAYLVECLTDNLTIVDSGEHQRVGAALSAERHMIELDDEWPNVVRH